MHQNPATILPFPVPPGLAESEVYGISVNGVAVSSECVQTHYDLETLPAWFRGADYVNRQQELHLASCQGSGRLHVRIEVKQTVVRATVQPASRGITPTVAGSAVEFDATGPDHLYVTIDDLPPLLLFANPPEVIGPVSNLPGTRVFGPGVHTPGEINLHDGESIYLAPGAIVYGSIRAKNASRIAVRGRGILDGGFEHRLVHIRDSRDVTFEGVILRNGRGWTNTLENCEDVTYHDVKVISFGPSGDGINPLNSRRVSIDRCFLRCADDCIAIKAPAPDTLAGPIRVTGCTMIGFAYADGITIGFETRNPLIADVVVSDCDILQARGGSRVDGHAAFSIICDGPATIRDIRYENIRVESDVLKLFELHVTDGTKYGSGPPGRISGVHVRNVTWASSRPIVLRGFDATHRVEDVVFEGCTIAGEPLVAARPDVFQVGEHVGGIRFVAGTEC